MNSLPSTPYLLPTYLYLNPSKEYGLISPPYFPLPTRPPRVIDGNMQKAQKKALAGLAEWEGTEHSHNTGYS